MPEVRVHKAGPSSGLHRLAEADPAFGAPYWAHWWGGGLALARFVLDRPGTVTGRSVLDLGCGSGLVAIAAARAGAARMLAADVDPYAVAACRLNAAANGVAVDVLHDDLTVSDPPDSALILVGDLFYDAGLAKRVTAFLNRCVAGGRKVLIGDPWRAHLPHERLTKFAEYEVREGATPRQAAVFAFT